MRSIASRGKVTAGAWRLATALVLAALWWSWPGHRAGAGVGSFELNPWERADQDPEAGAVTLADLEIEVEIDGGFASVRLRQTFMNRTSRALGGSYYLKLPPDAALMNFGAWDQGRWTEAVVMDKREARSAFDQIVQRAVDPALMEAPEAEITDAFKVAVAPIPAYGTSRVEASYHHWLKVRSLERRFTLPLQPGMVETAGSAQRVKVHLLVRDSLPLGEVRAEGPTGMTLDGVRRESAGPEGGQNRWEASYDGGPLALDRDLTVTIPLRIDASQLTLHTYRDAETETMDFSPAGRGKQRDPSGYFLVEAIYRREGAAAGQPEPERSPRDVVALFDTSMSMREAKLAGAMSVLEAVLAGLGPKDRFNLVTMDAQAAAWSHRLAEADSLSKDSALEFLRRTPLTTGTSLEDGFKKALSWFQDSDGRTLQVVAITDGQATVGRTGPAALIEEVLAGTSVGGGRVAIDCFGVGEDTDTSLLEELSRRSGGYFIWGRESEDLASKLAAFGGAILEEPILGVRLGLTPGAGVTDVYPEEAQVGFNLESLSWVGRYLTPQTSVRARVSGTRGAAPVLIEADGTLPERSTGSDFVARLWAERRVEHLLTLIRRDGEKEEWIAEIVSLSRRFKFPTPYTSYLVAPRAFLRPRVIRPRDPVLRVKAQAGTRAVAALFPFGEVHRLRYIARDDVWETRFLVPEGMRDGRYFCRLLLTDGQGKKHLEYKDFIVDSRPPRLKLKVKGPMAQPGRAIELIVDADPDTRTIRAGLASLPRVEIKWDPAARVNRGRILIPPDWKPGDYTINVWAEDFAHNATVAETRVRIGG